MGSIGAPTFLTGLLVPVRESGSLLPQIAVSNFVQRLAIRKYAYSIGVVIQSLSIALIALTGYSLEGLIAGVIIVCLVGAMALARCVCSICSKDVLGKTIPGSQRGQLMGLSNAIGGGIAVLIGIALIVGWLSSSNDLIGILLLATGCWLVTALVYAFVQETPGETCHETSLRSQLKSGLSLLRTDQAFRRFVSVRTFLMSSSLSAPYLVLLAQSGKLLSAQTAGNSDGSSLNGAYTLGLLIVISGLASLLSARIWGRLSDSSSRKVLMVTAALTAVVCLAAATVAAFGSNQLSPDAAATTTLVLFFALSVTHQGVRLGRSTYVVDIADGNKRTQYVSTSNSVIGLLFLLTGALAATIAQFSITLVLLAFATMAILALLFSRTMVEAR